MTTQADWPIHQIISTIRVVDTDREWVVQTPASKWTPSGHLKPDTEWVDRAYLTSRSMLNGELKRLVGKGAHREGLSKHVSQDVLNWLNALPGRHSVPECPASSLGDKTAPTVLDMLEAMGPEIHTTGELRDDLPLIVKHGPLKYRDRWNARFDC